LRGEDDLAGSWLVVLAGATVGPYGAGAILRDRRVGVAAPVILRDQGVDKVPAFQPGCLVDSYLVWVGGDVDRLDRTP